VPVVYSLLDDISIRRAAGSMRRLFGARNRERKAQP